MNVFDINDGFVCFFVFFLFLLSKIILFNLILFVNIISEGLYIIVVCIFVKFFFGKLGCLLNKYCEIVNFNIVLFKNFKCLLWFKWFILKLLIKFECENVCWYKLIFW